MSLHFGATTLAVRWVYRERPDAFPLVRTTLIVSTALALAGYVLYPAAPPRLAGIGFSDTVTTHTGLNLSSDLLGSFYNPLAAVPSLHFGYALIVGVALVALARRRWVRVLGAAYPAFMLFDIVATGNHFLVRRDGGRRGRRRRLVDRPHARPRIEGAGALAAAACPERTCPGDCPWASR